MLDIDEICKRLIFHEGLVLTPYKCPMGKLTIGVGHNLDSRNFTEKEKKALGDYQHGITKNGALMVLRNDIEICLTNLKTLSFWKSLDNERQYALLDMCFQLGFKGLKKFRKMLKAFENKDFETASKQCLNSLYSEQTPKRANRISNLIRTGIWKI